jgi:hypothetical protein
MRGTLTGSVVTDGLPKALQHFEQQLIAVRRNNRYLLLSLIAKEIL